MAIYQEPVQLDSNDIGLIEEALRRQMVDNLRTYASFSDSGIGIPGNAQRIQMLLTKLRDRRLPG